MDENRLRFILRRSLYLHDLNLSRNALSNIRGTAGLFLCCCRHRILCVALIRPFIILFFHFHVVEMQVAFSWILGGTTDALLNNASQTCSDVVLEEKCGSPALAAELGQVGRIRGVVTHLVAAPLGIPATEAMVSYTRSHVQVWLM